MEGVLNTTHTSMESALQEVFQTSLSGNGLIKGSHECVKALDKREALLCVFASDCDEPNYVKLVEALCAEHNIDLIKVDDKKKLGELAGLCEIDKEGKARKIVNTSCVVVKDWVQETPGFHYVKNAIKMNA